MKDIRSLLLILLSSGLVATWVYHLYDKAKYSQNRPPIPAAGQIAMVNDVRDSLQEAYTEKLNDLDFKLDSSRNTTDSLQLQLNRRVNEINKLKGEISAILKNPVSSSAQLKEAKQKMTELEERVEELRVQNGAMEAEKQSMITKLDLMTGEANTMEQNIRRLDEENKDLREKIRQASVFLASALHFTAIDVRNEKEQETAQSKKADKFVVSFVVQNNLNQYMNAEVFVVITQPDGQILQNSTWDSGTFDTKADGRKSFTRRIKFDYEKGEQRRMIFSLDADNPQKGKYTMQVWHQGIMIGETTKTLH